MSVSAWALLVEQLRAQRFHVRQMSDGHVFITSPSGVLVKTKLDRGRPPVGIAMRSLESRLRRLGFWTRAATAPKEKKPMPAMPMMSPGDQLALAQRLADTFPKGTAHERMKPVADAAQCSTSLLAKLAASGRRGNVTDKEKLSIKRGQDIATALTRYVAGDLRFALADEIDEIEQDRADALAIGQSSSAPVPPSAPSAGWSSAMIELIEQELELRTRTLREENLRLRAILVDLHNAIEQTGILGTKEK